MFSRKPYPIRYLSDVMLKRLTRWLRMFGIPVVYPDTEDDDRILEEARDLGVILLTSDKELSKKAGLKGVKTLLIISQRLDDQLIEFFIKSGERPSDPDRMLLCPVCNGELIPMDKQLLREKVPERVYEYQDRFWVCNSCGKVFWKGTHYERIKKKFNMLIQRIDQTDP